MKKLMDRFFKWELLNNTIAERSFTLAYAATLLIYMIAAFLATNHMAQKILFNADALWMEEYLRDWLNRGINMQTWYTPGAPNFFPEMLIYGLFRYATGSVYGALIGFGLVKLILYAALIYGLISWLNNIPRIYRLWFSMFCATMLLLSMIFWGTVQTGAMIDYWQLFEPAAHGGAIINALIALLLLFHWFRNPEKGFIWLLLLFFLSVLASLSDMLFVVWFGLPALCAAAALYLMKRISWRSAFWLFDVLLISELIGKIIMGWLCPIQPVSYHSELNQGFQYTFDFYKGLITQGWYYPIVLFSYICLVFILLCNLFLLWKKRNDQSQNQAIDSHKTTLLFLQIYAVLVLPISFTAMSLINRAEIQYFTGGDLLTLSVWGFLLIMSPFGWRLWAKGWAHTAIIVTQAGYLCFLAIFFSTSLLSMLIIPNPYSELAACLDSHVQDFRGGAGLADYWQTRQINLFSRKGIHIDQVYSDKLIVYPYMSNQEMLMQRKHTFVLANTPTNVPEITEDGVIRLYGQPDARFICASYPVLVYYNGIKLPYPSNLNAFNEGF